MGFDVVIWVRDRVDPTVAWVRKQRADLKAWLGPTGSPRWLVGLKDILRMLILSAVNGSLAAVVTVVYSSVDQYKNQTSIDGRITAAVSIVTAIVDFIRRMRHDPRRIAANYRAKFEMENAEPLKRLEATDPPTQKVKFAGNAAAEFSGDADSSDPLDNLDDVGAGPVINADAPLDPVFKTVAARAVGNLPDATVAKLEAAGLETIAIIALLARVLAQVILACVPAPTSSERFQKRLQRIQNHPNGVLAKKASGMIARMLPEQIDANTRDELAKAAIVAALAARSPETLAKVLPRE